MSDADLLGLDVVRVVIAGAEHVGAEHDSALDLRAESGLARPVVHLGEASRPARGRPYRTPSYRARFALASAVATM